MKRFLGWQVVVSALLLGSSAALYLVDYRLVGDGRSVALSLLGNLAFLPVQVLLVTVMVDRLLAIHEREQLVKKLNMVIGAFFSEVGHPLLLACRPLDGAGTRLDERLAGLGRLEPRDLQALAGEARRHRPALALDGGQAEALRLLLVARRPFLLALMENGNLLEHQSFTDLLWAVFHLSEELAARGDLRAAKRLDLEHLAGDVARAFPLLTAEWLLYLRHLREDYPYLFSLEARKNPFDGTARVEVSG
jgi:hypothetical protein